MKLIEKGKIQYRLKENNIFHYKFHYKLNLQIFSIITKIKDNYFQYNSYFKMMQTIFIIKILTDKVNSN